LPPSLCAALVNVSVHDPSGAFEVVPQVTAVASAASPFAWKTYVVASGTQQGNDAQD
jgi:hypothetical protein